MAFSWTQIPMKTATFEEKEYDRAVERIDLPLAMFSFLGIEAFCAAFDLS